MERIQRAQPERPLEAGVLDLIFQGELSESIVPVAPVAQTLLALQGAFTAFASSSDPALGRFRSLTIPQRRQLFRLQVLDAWTDSLHLRVGPNKKPTESMPEWVSESLPGAFDSMARALATDIAHLNGGEYAEPIKPANLRAIRSISSSLKPDRVALRLNLLVLQVEIGFDMSKRLEDFEREHRHQLRAAPDHEGALEAAAWQAPMLQSAEDREGPYIGKVVSVELGSRTLTFKCYDYTEPIPCHYPPTLDGIAARLQGGQEIAIYGVPVRMVGARKDKPPIEINHADISTH